MIIVRDRETDPVSLRKRLAHQPRLQSDVAVAHLAFQLGARDQRGHRVDDQHVHRAGAHQRVGDLERLLAGVGLRDQQVVDIDAKLAGVHRIECVLRVDEGADAAFLLRLGDRVQRQRRLAGALRAVDLDDAATRQAADAKRDIETDRSGRDDLGVDRLALSEPHDRALAERTLDLADRSVDGSSLLGAFLFHHRDSAYQHRVFLYSMRTGNWQSRRNARYVRDVKAIFLTY